MYHVTEYLKKAGSIFEKSKSPEPPNEVARLTEKGFENWTIGRAAAYFMHSQYEKIEKEMKEKNKKARGEM